MERSDVISKVLMFGTIGLILQLGVQASKKQPVTNTHGDIVLTTPKFYGIIGRVGLIAVAAFCIRIAISSKGWGPISATEDVLLGAVVIIGFLLMGVYLVLFSINSKTIVNDESIINTNRLKKEQTIKWENIKKITFGKISQTLTIYDQNNNFGTHRHAIGFDEYVEKIKQKVDPKLYEEAMKNYKETQEQNGVED